jgi:hypothetical protein
MMKKAIITLWIVLTTLSLITAQTPGTLTVTATTSNAGGNYQPKNIVAIWIEDDQGNFVKTLLAYAQNRKMYLDIWEATTTAAGSPFNTVDAITGATKTSHGTRTCFWDGTDVNGNLVSDGTYKLRMELTDKHATGNYSSFTITKDTNPENLTPANVPSFSSIIINWEPVLTSVEDIQSADAYNVCPNPSSGIFTISGQNIHKVQVYNLAGGCIYQSVFPSVDIKDQPDGIYFLKIISDKGISTRKIIKNSRAQ